ncbi:NADPH-dependent FMN reductase [Bordetella sp. N]|jgi:NAD(P)H-dependent FMN reductase|uniref:NADPH-dependent FMN reductase n=1 Tax=Bordetella sp. N TaxID=1746199 RepID=UPI00070AA6C7|nr:NAD(P)H-dependent oxidoreductase [Bordetella sp. N]ALM85438.1 NADPH-dependent FMN reductase [Bordetella sp. N]
MSTKPRLNVIIASTRPGRVGPAFAQWFYDAAVAHGQFDVQLVDLADFRLPVFDEPNHPRMQKYTHEHTRKWAASVASADAFVFVTPEYNFNAPPSLLNALQYLYTEWNYKPASFVSYAHASGGLRAVQEVKTLLTTLKIVPLNEQVMVPNFTQTLDENGKFQPTQLHNDSAKVALDELLRWTNAIKPLRAA